MQKVNLKRKTEVENEKKNQNENEDDGDLRKYDLANMPEYIQAEIDAFLADFPEISEKYTLCDRVGEGAFSTVYKGYLKSNPQYSVAMKRIYFTSRPSRVENEIKFLLDLGGRHNIVKMVDGLRKKDQIILILEHFEHTNFKQFMKSVSIRQLQLYLRSLFESLAYIHMKGVIHHDVKPSNFLYNKDLCKGVLVDFGLAQYANKSQTNVKRNEESNGVKINPSLMIAPLPGINSISQKVPQIQQQHSHFQPFGLIQQQQQLFNPQSPISQLIHQQHHHHHHHHLHQHQQPILQQQPIILPQVIDINSGQNGMDSSKRYPPVNKNMNDLKIFGQQQQLQHLQLQQHVQQQQIYVNPNDKRPVLRASRAGTRGFRAPEILWKDVNQTIAVDVWSAGVILLTLLTGRYPFFQSSDDMTGLAELSCVFGQKEMTKAALQASGIKLTFRGIPEGPDYSKDWRDFCNRLNPTLNEQMPQSVYDLLGKCLELNPRERITAKEAYLHEFLQNLHPE